MKYILTVFFLAMIISSVVKAQDSGIIIPPETKSSIDGELALKLLEINCKDLDSVELSDTSFAQKVVSQFQFKCNNKKQKKSLTVMVNLVIKKIEFSDSDGILFSLLQDNDPKAIDSINKAIDIRSSLRSHQIKQRDDEVNQRISKFLK